MGLYQLSNYLLICDPSVNGFGCSQELVIEQARSERAAADAAIEQGWRVSPPGYGDSWSAWCPKCWSEFEARRAEWKAEQAANA